MGKKKYKVVLLGEGRVGKTSILLRFCKNEYDGRQPPTLNASYIDKRITIGNIPIHLSIWDTAGQERFHALGPIYYRDADAALLVYDITDAESFTKVRKWVRELRKIVGEDIAIAIAGNKIDLEKNRHVQETDATSYASSVGASHFHTSAKLNKGLDETFLDLARKIIEKHGINENSSTSTSSASANADDARRRENQQQAAGSSRLVLVDDNETEQGSASAESSCC